jgi:hypothetical protein
MARPTGCSSSRAFEGTTVDLQAAGDADDAGSVFARSLRAEKWLAFLVAQKACIHFRLRRAHRVQ